VVGVSEAPPQTQTDYNATVTDQIYRHVTIVDHTHPFFGRTFPVIRETSSLGTSYLVVQLPTCRTRSVPIAATDDMIETSTALPSGLMPISARTLLPVARHLHVIMHAREEAHHDASFGPQPEPNIQPSDTAPESAPSPHERRGRARCPSGYPVRSTSRGAHPTHSGPQRRRSQGDAL